MKKIITILIASIILVAFSSSLVGCKKPNPSHSHTFSQEWTYDSQSHWHKATCEHTNEISVKYPHSLEHDECAECGYKVKRTITSEEWNSAVAGEIYKNFTYNNHQEIYADREDVQPISVKTLIHKQTVDKIAQCYDLGNGATTKAKYVVKIESQNYYIEYNATQEKYIAVKEDNWAVFDWFVFADQLKDKYSQFQFVSDEGCYTAINFDAMMGNFEYVKIWFVDGVISKIYTEYVLSNTIVKETYLISKIGQTTIELPEYTLAE